MVKQLSGRNLTKQNSNLNNSTSRDLGALARSLSRDSNSLTHNSDNDSLSSSGHNSHGNHSNHSGGRMTPTRRSFTDTKHRIIRDAAAPTGRGIYRHNSSSSLVGGGGGAASYSGTSNNHLGFLMGSDADTISLSSGDTRFSGKTV